MQAEIGTDWLDKARKAVSGRRSDDRIQTRMATSEPLSFRPFSGSIQIESFCVLRLPKGWGEDFLEF